MHTALTRDASHREWSPQNHRSMRTITGCRVGNRSGLAKFGLRCSQNGAKFPLFCLYCSGAIAFLWSVFFGLYAGKCRDRWFYFPRRSSRVCTTDVSASVLMSPNELSSLFGSTTLINLSVFFLILNF